MQEPTLISGKALDRYFDLQRLLIEFSDMFNNGANDREIAIIGGVFLDTLLEDILINFLVDDEKEIQRLLRYDQPMGTYSGRTTSAYCLGLFNKIILDDLRVVGKIRNRFAHDLNASFEDDPIRSWCISLKWHRISMFRSPPDDATARDFFQVGVNQLICHLNGITSISREEKRQIPQSPE